MKNYYGSKRSLRIFHPTGHPRLVNFWLRVETATLINMLFKKKGRKQPQEDDIEPPAAIDSDAPTCTAADEGKTKDLKHIHTDITYPSGLKLALLMMSIFVSMFLVSLVC